MKRVLVLAIALIMTFSLAGCGGGDLTDEEKAFVGNWTLTDLMLGGESYMAFMGEIEGDMTIEDNKTGNLNLTMEGEESSITFDWGVGESGTVDFEGSDGSTGVLSIVDGNVHFEAEGMDFVFSPTS